MRTFYILVFFGVVSVAGWTSADACSCKTPILNARDEAAREFNAAKIVFEGEVISVERAQPHDLSGVSPEASHVNPTILGANEITFRVLKKYRGLPEETVRVYLDEARTDCSIDANIGEKWFVYGFEGGDAKVYIATCSRSNWLGGADADIRYAREESARDEDLVPQDEKMRVQFDPTLKERGATLSGAIRRLDGHSLSNGVDLTLWDLDEHGQRNGQRAAQQRSNSDGTFVIHYISPGSYIFTAEDPNWTPTSRFIGIYGRVELKERANITGVDLVLHPDPLGTITVRVEPSEALRKDMFVRLTDSDFGPANAKLFMFGDSVDLSAGGVARFEKVPYASYDAEVEVSGLPRRINDSPIPGWCQEDTKVRLEGHSATLKIHLHKCPEK